MPFEPKTAIKVLKTVPVKLVENSLKTKWFETLEQNQKIASCCRHPENHSIEGWKSNPTEPAPDVYIFTCDCCGNQHHFFCAGEIDVRPVWNNTIGEK